MKYRYIFLFLLAVGLNACKKDAAAVEYYYAQTYCFDRWCQGNPCNSEADVKQAVSNYLSDSLQVQFSNLRLTDETAPEGCLACSCKTGKWIRISASDAYKAKLLDAGFKAE